MFCFRFPAKRRAGANLYTCSGKVAPISPGDTVQILDERDYTVLRVNPHSGTAVLRRTDATPNQRSFLRPSTAICVLPSASRDACVMVGEPTSNCLCEPTPPPVLPDTNDTGVQCSVDADEYSAFLTEQFENVTTLERAFKEARKEASNTLDVLCEQLEKSQALEDEHEKLEQRLSKLTIENETLLKRTFELKDELATLKSLAASHLHTPVLQRMLAHHVTLLPLHSEAEDAPANLLFHFLGCTPTTYNDVLQENIRVLLDTLHPDKNQAVSAAASKFIPLIKKAKRILSDSNLKRIYLCCGMSGVRRSDMGLRTCHHCDPFLRTLDNLMDL